MPAGAGQGHGLGQELPAGCRACVAPSALRTPISRVRSVTETSMMFITPTPPTTQADRGDGDHHHVDAARDLAVEVGERVLGEDREVVLRPGTSACARGAARSRTCSTASSILLGRDRLHVGHQEVEARVPLLHGAQRDQDDVVAVHERGTCPCAPCTPITRKRRPSIDDLLVHRVHVGEERVRHVGADAPPPRAPRSTSVVGDEAALLARRASWTVS